MSQSAGIYSEFPHDNIGGIDMTNGCGLLANIMGGTK